MVHDLNEQSFSAKIFDLNEGENAPLLIRKNTVLEFWVTWCPHCHDMIPRYTQVSEQFPGVDCYRVEMEQHPDIAELFDVQSFPTFIFIRKDGKMKKWEGELPTAELADLVSDAFGDDV